MSPIKYVPEVKSWLDLRPGSNDMEIYNLERVRGYMEKNPNCLNKQIMIDLDLSQHTVERAILAVRKQQGFKR